jgi:hypothetical protein
MLTPCLLSGRGFKCWLVMSRVPLNHIYIVSRSIKFDEANRFPDWNLWRKYRAIPELFDAVTHKPVVLAYPLRPGKLYHI